MFNRFFFWLRLSCSGILAVSMLLPTSCSRGGQHDNPERQQLHGQVSVSGAFALYPLAVQWANEFQAENPGVRIDVSAGGAGKGMTDVINGMVDFAMMSRDLHEEEYEKGAIDFIVARDAVIPTLNAGNPLAAKALKRGITAEDARKVWVTGEIKTWGQLLGTSDKEPIHVYTRSDACGAAQTFASWFDATQEDMQGTAVYGDPGIARAVRDDVWGMGFNNLAYAYDPQTHRTYEGLSAFPIDADGDRQISPGEQVYATKEMLVKAIEEDSFPSPPARNLYLVSNGAPTDSAVVAFLEYILDEGQDFNEPSGYVKISAKVHQQNLHKLNSSRRGQGLKADTTDTVAIVCGIIALIAVCLLSAPLFIRSFNKRRVYKQRLSSGYMLFLAILAIIFLICMVGGLLLKSMPILRSHSFWQLISSTEWKPSQGQFGFLAFICGTLAVTVLSMVLAVPVSLMTAVFLSEYSKKTVRDIVYPALDILAAIPSVVYGVWGILVLIPIFGYSLVTAALVLCAMVFPILISLLVEIFSGVSNDLRDASTSLGATRWQTTKKVVLKKSVSGIFASTVLAISKAAGETIAVMMVCGSIPAIPKSILRGFYTLPALIGNNYGEMASVPLYESAIMFAALILLVLVLIFNIISRVILYNIDRD